MAVSGVVPLLQAAVTPCIIISGVGLLVLSISNRFGRPVDRIRALLPEFHRGNEEDKQWVSQEIQILYNRAKLLQKAVFCSVLAIFFVAAIILLIFFDFLTPANLERLIEVCFVGVIVSLALALLFFMRDITLTLHSLKLEIFERNKVPNVVE